MRRTLVLAAATVLGIGAFASAAQAATAPILSYKGLPSDWHGLSIPCVSGSPAAYAPPRVYGPATPPSGGGSARVSGTSSNSPVLFFGPTESPLLSTLSAFDGWVYVPISAAATPVFHVEASDGAVGYSLDLAASGTGWVHLDTASPTVLKYDSFNNQTNTAGPSGTTTLSDFEAAHTGAIFDAFVIAPQSCGVGTYYLDDVHYAVGTTDNTVDFEAPLPSSLANGSHPSSVLTGTPTTLTATLASAGTPLAGQSVALYAHGVGTSWHLVTTRTSDVNGAVSLKVTPTSTTTYQWRFAATGTNYAPVNASSFLIASRQRVLVTSKPTSTVYRGTAVIKGRVTPHKTGVTIQLVRLVSGKRIVVASTKTVMGGYFTLKAPMNTRGTYSYVVAAVPYTGEALGQSSSFKITTR